MPEIICSQCGKLSELDVHNRSCPACGKEFPIIGIVRAITKEGLAEAAKLVAESQKNRVE